MHIDDQVVQECDQRADNGQTRKTVRREVFWATVGAACWSFTGYSVKSAIDAHRFEKYEKIVSRCQEIVDILSEPPAPTEMEKAKIKDPEHMV